MPRVFKTNTVNIEKKDNLYKFIYENGEKFPTFFEKIKKNFNIEKEKKGSSFTIKAKNVEKLTELLKKSKILDFDNLFLSHKKGLLKNKFIDKEKIFIENSFKKLKKNKMANDPYFISIKNHLKENLHNENNRSY